MSSNPHSGTVAAPTLPDFGHGAGHAHGHHDPDVAHHFDSANQQFDAGKLGIWAFLVTEVLFFSGLFCAYSIWRSNHPEIFLFAQHYLDTKLGATNTVVLLFSSLTAAWAVRCAQLNQKRGLVVCLALTLLCAFGFLGIKYVEYSHKIHEGIGWGNGVGWNEDVRAATAFNPQNPILTTLDSRGHYHKVGYALDIARERGLPIATPEERAATVTALRGEFAAEPEGVRTFFAIYYGMTGLHGIHVLGGIVVFVWLLVRALKGRFHAGYFGPVDYCALYWHLVDLVWIYLFPMLYLIH
jgi:cytochrome c oxidase subunit III